MGTGILVDLRLIEAGFSGPTRIADLHLQSLPLDEDFAARGFIAALACAAPPSRIRRFRFP